MNALSPLNFRRRIGALLWARRLFWLVGLVLFWCWPRVGTLIGVFLVGMVLNGALKAWEMSARRQFIREARLPGMLVGKLIAAYPQLTPRDAELVLRGLRQFFMAHLRSDRKFVSMPSQVVDAAWHEFILHTAYYQQWCQSAFGRMLHHTPAEVLGRDARRNDGLRRTWYWACKEESIDPRKPTRLPLLFALDAKLGVANGFHYVPDCGAIDRAADSGTQCGSSFSSSDAGAGDAGGLGGSDSSGAEGSSSDSSSSSSDSGCGGGGCGGGGGD